MQFSVTDEMRRILYREIKGITFARNGVAGNLTEYGSLLNFLLSRNVVTPEEVRTWVSSRVRMLATGKFEAPTEEKARVFAAVVQLAGLTDAQASRIKDNNMYGLVQTVTDKVLEQLRTAGRPW